MRSPCRLPKRLLIDPHPSLSLRGRSSRSGGIGRRVGFKIRWASRPVRVRVPPSALISLGISHLPFACVVRRHTSCHTIASRASSPDVPPPSAATRQTQFHRMGIHVRLSGCPYDVGTSSEFPKGAAAFSSEREPGDRSTRCALPTISLRGIKYPSCASQVLTYTHFRALDDI